MKIFESPRDLCSRKKWLDTDSDCCMYNPFFTPGSSEEICHPPWFRHSFNFSMKIYIYICMYIYNSAGIMEYIQFLPQSIWSLSEIIPLPSYANVYISYILVPIVCRSTWLWTSDSLTGLIVLCLQLHLLFKLTLMKLKNARPAIWLQLNQGLFLGPSLTVISIC